MINDQEDQALPLGDFDENPPRRRPRALRLKDAEHGEGESFSGVVIPLSRQSNAALQYCNLGFTAPLVSFSARPIELPFALGNDLPSASGKNLSGRRLRSVKTSSSWLLARPQSG